MARGSWDKAEEVLSRVLSDLGVSSRASTSGTLRSIEADWYYSLGPRQQARALAIVRSTTNLLRLVGEVDATEQAPAVEDLATEVAWALSVAKKTESSFQHGSFEVTPMGVSKAQVQDVLAALDEVSRAVHSKFPNLLYGKVFITKVLPKSHLALASYVDDVLYISTKAKDDVGSVYALCHELGHRFEKKFWSNKSQRARFMELSTASEYESIDFNSKLRKQLTEEFLESLHDRAAGRPVKAPSYSLSQLLKERMADDLAAMRSLSVKAIQGDSKAEVELAALVEGSRDLTVKTDKIIRGPLLVTSYGAKSWVENFAEAFAHLVLGKTLPPEIAEVMNQL